MRLLISSLAIALLVAACAAEPPRRDCSFVVWAKGARAAPSVSGTFNDWSEPGTAMTAYGEDDWYYLVLDLPPGEHGYLVTDDDGTHPDPHNPQRTYHGEVEVSLALAGDCSKPAVEVGSVIATDGGEVTVSAAFLRAKSGSPPAEARAVAASGATLEAELTAETGEIVFHGSGFTRGKHTFRLEVVDASGARAEAPAVVAWVKPAARRWDEGILYQVVVDRFRGDGGAELAAPLTAGHRAGGTLDGVRAALESGYFDSLGVSALWLSPVYENPAGMLEGRDGHMFEGYHGYWPLKSRAVEPRIGGEKALEALIGAAHRRGLAVIFDFVPNHLYEMNERYTAHGGDGWFNNGPEQCVCGTKGCSWGERIQDCWFAPYLPDVRWQAEGSMRSALDDLRFWMSELDADGVRIDAVPMMPRLATRRMALALREETAPAGAMLSIGEVYTGPGREGADSIRYFLGPDGLGGAFDFPLAWALREVIAQRRAGFDAVEETLLYSEKTWDGSGAVIGRMVGNHDMTRFISEASGHGSADAWKHPAPDPADVAPYEALRLGLSLVLTLPGLPVFYYGDEVGLAGGSDPDNRRVLPAEDGLSPAQRSVLEAARRLGKLRACSPALRAGSRDAFLVAERTYGFARVSAEESALVMLSTDSAEVLVAPPLKAVPAGAYSDAFTGETFMIGAGDPVPLAPSSFRVLLPENSPCLEAPTSPP